MASTRIVGDRPYYTRHSLAHDFDISDYTVDKVRNDVNYLSYYTKNRDAVAADDTGKNKKQLSWSNVEYLDRSLETFLPI